MPELPEVETVVRTIAPRVAGRRIVEIRTLQPRVVRNDLGPASGRRIRAVRRHGKHILVEVDGGLLDIHLGMTGKLLAGGSPGPYTRVVFRLDRGVLLFDDVRQFGRIEWSEGLPERVARLGPDALAVGLEEFRQILGRGRARIKPLLLDQKAVRGIGNIYADESLFRARIHPRARAASLSRERAARLHRAIADILTKAIELRGSSVSDYVDADGRRGTFQRQHKVYGRTGLPCPACGAAIRRIVVAQRGTHYCPRCQRA